MKKERWSQVIVVVLIALLCIPCFAATSSVNIIYDDLNRLVREEDYGNGKTTVYDYDEVGNRTARHIAQQSVVISTPGYNGSISPTGTITINVGQSTGNYTWSIVNQQPGTPGQTVAQITGSATGNSVTVQALNLGTFQVLATPVGGGSAMSGSTISVITPQNVKIAWTANTYTTLQDAYNAAADGDTILSQGISLTGNLLATRNISVTVDGGYDPNFMTKIGNTLMKGRIQTFSGSGTLTVKNITLTDQYQY